MPDRFTTEIRSKIMSKIRGKNTKPEIIVRKLIHGMGYRYRLHAKNLPGKPDIIFASRRKVIFVHGCFWHRHPDPNCTLARLPKSRLDFWRTKLEHNRRRDLSHLKKLKQLGWDHLVIWECQLKNLASISARARAFLEKRRK